MRYLLLKVLLPWGITAAALFLAFRGVEWDHLLSHLRNAQIGALLAAIGCTAISYILRAARWPLLFPRHPFSLFASWRVLILGFFMNNILPARAGELVRAHLGGKISGQPRTLVLATIASERLADGVTLSVLFVGAILALSSQDTHHIDQQYTDNLLTVAALFGAASFGVVGVLCARNPLFRALDGIATRIDARSTTFLLHKAKVFIEGLTPLCEPRRAAQIAVWSLVVWGIEAVAFYAISAAFSSPLTLSSTVIFLVAVNFSSLIPAAPGGFGVIELIAKKVLLSIGVASDELALSLVLTQHLIQYAVVGIPGILLLEPRSAAQPRATDSTPLGPPSSAQHALSSLPSVPSEAIQQPARRKTA
jgi:uncharacterized protein (TIRG00374 family)